MYERNKNKRRFYEDFKGSTPFYGVIIPQDSAYESNGARRKYATKIDTAWQILVVFIRVTYALAFSPHDWRHQRKGRKLGKSPAAALFRIYLISKTTKHPQKVRTVYVYETNSSERERTCFNLPIIYRRRHHTIGDREKERLRKNNKTNSSCISIEQ